MKPDRASLGFRVFCGLVGVAVLCIAGIAVVAIAAGGYRPEDYAGRFDPIRAGLVVAMALTAVAFALVLGAQLLAWIRDGQRPTLAAIAFPAGLAVIGATAAVLLITWPEGPDREPFRVAFIVGLGLIVAALASDAIKRFVELVRHRAWFEAALMLVAAVFLVGLVLIRIQR